MCGHNAPLSLRPSAAPRSYFAITGVTACFFGAICGTQGRLLRSCIENTCCIAFIYSKFIFKYRAAERHQIRIILITPAACHKVEDHVLHSYG